MSFLLDALRKSEKQRRLGDLPNIHSATELESRATRKPGRNAILLLAAFGVVAWFGWRWYAPPEKAVVTQKSQQVEPRIDADNMGSQDSSRMLPAIPRSTSTNNVQEPGRTAVERYPGPAGTGSGSHSETTNAFSDPPPAATMVAEETDGDQGQEEDGEPDDGQPFQPGLISYWQLPESVRQQMQTFRISVIVFAKKPQDRFILLNGVRLVEGDEAERDLVLEEIRREGAVFSYRHYQFLVTQ